MPYYTNEEGVRLFYEEVGKGQALVFIHPPGMGRKVFKFQKELSCDFRVIFPDLSGNGDSDLATDRPDISWYAGEILQLLDHLRIQQAVVVGYSCGGMVAQEFALTYPERLTALILAGGFPKVSTGGLKFEFYGGMSWVEKSPETLARLLSHSHFRDETIKQELNDHMAKSNPSAWHSFYDRALHYDCSHRVGLIDKPMLLVYGSKEFWISEHSKYYHPCPNARMYVIENAYHQTPATHYDRFNDEVRHFVKGLGTPQSSVISDGK
ncbi:alpha/beta hydrolase [Halobacillus sp. ACCC02827]|uniref:alpha/beta fold hydrolase n=1 Tax=unclassified Halobacillus TaxID=2636472 RepID=UPI0002A4E28F|nr:MULTISPECIES: alpha/beta hydrolase [unclassified Halobacillus]ELK46682.1 AB hydrolase superfamily protein [Halobacillus sp. BAB-2008]WJE16089.1 alpha/beta hydrolase [Halobacillus sp. ACCC02827]